MLKLLACLAGALVVILAIVGWQMTKGPPSQYR
jgi:hypothetical protein